MLRNPEFGNIFRVHIDSVLNRTVDGDLKVYQRTQNYESMSMSYRALSKDQVDQFKAYVIATYGKIVKMKDHENRTWQGWISSPELRISIRNNCDISLSFDFEGTLV